MEFDKKSKLYLSIIGGALGLVLIIYFLGPSLADNSVYFWLCMLAVLSGAAGIVLCEREKQVTEDKSKLKKILFWVSVANILLATVMFFL